MRREWDSDSNNPGDPSATIGIDPLLPAKYHEVPGTIWWERRSYIDDTPVLRLHSCPCTLALNFPRFSC